MSIDPAQPCHRPDGRPQHHARHGQRVRRAGGCAGVALGFEVAPLRDGHAARRAGGKPVRHARQDLRRARHFAFAGHLDVVPPGDGWESGPFAPEIRGNILYGRGACDMKGSIAAFVAAIPADHAGRISLIITGDEEGPALYGTRALITYMEEQQLVPDLCLVGEPTSAQRLGDMIKIGRRGSAYFKIIVPGTQGHVAYPHLADNPVPKLVRILKAIDDVVLDEGTDWFQASNIEITNIDVGNTVGNVIPGQASANLSIRFNDTHSGASLTAMIETIATTETPQARVEARISGEPFLTQPGELSALVGEAIRSVTGLEAELSTTGGTSDARFLSRLCPVVEFGLPNATMHKLDEAVALEDLTDITRIYTAIIAGATALPTPA
jgi:succinyl-diaminopimelate desuccinylase